jgi:Protein of unknown function DUF111
MTMRTAYFDCFSGISGDMTIGALIDAGLSFEDLRAQLALLNVRMAYQNNGFRSCRISPHDRWLLFNRVGIACTADERKACP